MIKFISTQILFIFLMINSLYASQIENATIASKAHLSVSCRFEAYEVLSQQTLYLDLDNPMKAKLFLPEYIDDLVLTTDLSVFCDRATNTFKDLVYMAPVSMVKEQITLLPSLQGKLDQLMPQAYVFLFAYGGQADLEKYDFTSLVLDTSILLTLDNIWETCHNRITYEPEPGIYLGCQSWHKIKVRVVSGYPD